MSKPLEHEATTETVPADQGLMASLGLNVQQFGFQLFNFVLVLCIVWFMILKPLTKQLDARKKIIDESLDHAKEVESNLMMSQQKFNETIQEAKNESNAIIQKAHDEAEKLATDMKDKAKKELADLIEKAKKTVASEKEEMKAELHKETVELVILTAEKILGQKLDGKKDEEFIRDILKSVK
jgi:F-type H+-transporting ATPase subunit b